MSKIKILIPGYNDWKSVFKLLEDIDLQVNNLNHEFSIIVVNDCSTEERPFNNFNFKNLKFIKVINMKKNPVSAVLDFVGVNRVIKYFDDLTFSQTADELSTAMVSDDGIDALINLAQNWKDKNAAVKYVKALVGIETLAEDEF